MAQNAKISVSGFYRFCKKKTRDNDAFIFMMDGGIKVKFCTMMLKN